MKQQQVNYENVQMILSDFLNDQDKSFCFITAASKSMVLRRYCQMHKNAVYMKVPPTVRESPKSFTLAILESLGILSIKSHLSEIQLISLIGGALREKQVSCFVIDDMQEIKYSIRSLELIDMLRLLSEEAQVKFVFTGIEMPELSERAARRSIIQKAV